MQRDLTAIFSGQQKDVHDGFAIDGVGIVTQGNLGFVQDGHFDKLGRSPGVKTEFIDDFDFFDNAFVHIMCNFARTQDNEYIFCQLLR
ncbi:MAG: hypothetical protein ACD_62C00625G0005 [uncultured bacterium]|nr:MAG: hypothetical protein ACD_62C00625G0005 [uncultured bacterium]